MMRTYVVTMALAVATLAGCQTYDFELVEPLAIAQYTEVEPIGERKLKPNLMILVDKSGSMNTPIFPAKQPECGTCGPALPCPASCPTRISELRSAMATFLTDSGSVARMALTFFPKDMVCSAPNALTDVVEPFPPPAAADDAASDMASAMTAMAINSKIQSIAPGGGTPTNNSLRFVGGSEGLNTADNRDDYVLLLTDGVPNCNDQNPNNCCGDTNACNAPAACQCTTNSCMGGLCALGCLDRQGVVEAAQDLQTRGIRTIVVGFGIGDTLGSDQQNAPEILTAVAEAGGFLRQCKDNATCGTGDRCIIAPGSMAGLCERKYFRATNGTELANALKAISEGIRGNDLCEFTLQAQPNDERYIAVIIDGTNQAAGPETWAFRDAKVIFQGAMCNRLKAATQNAQIKVEIRIVKTL